MHREKAGCVNSMFYVAVRTEDGRNLHLNNFLAYW
jgi:hypothetical protein